ncbi:ABC transporter permease [Maritimibacter sp. DP07]|uniref:Autoinducer 2 import system permease protein LsrC n=1 Tax=Maritimibacter harenae TaxID=2606218 RepID=A0A845M1H6_9RHOB|nr:ABC transporter permease [Maritimibacter harenae]MZR13426.1 ABC transporter permease [Maritimibacter harenae]
MQSHASETVTRHPSEKPGLRVPTIQMRFAAIWIAFVVLVLIGAVFLPRSIQPSALQSVLPFAAFLAIASMGQSLVIMVRGIDLSVPAIVTLSSTLLLGISRGADEMMAAGVIIGLLGAAGVGMVNGILVAVFRLNALIVTMAVGSVVAGLTLWYRQGLPAEASVPQSLSKFGSQTYLGINTSVWIALILTCVITIVLRRTLIGRQFETVGSNPDAAHATGVRSASYQAGAFVAAAVLYGIVGIILSAFIRNPTLEVGQPYLLAPIAAAVLAATSINGGIGSMIAVLGGALFLTHLGQMLKLIGLETSYQMIIQGVAIAVGMFLSSFFEGRKR